MPNILQPSVLKENILVKVNIFTEKEMTAMSTEIHHITRLKEIAAKILKFI